ncbi:MAG: hypothetical protein FWG87_10095 [Defluviitaleaceae bacterium]|nr:hypothetical protein [Defluviitaleaceae bacterium]
MDCEFFKGMERGFSRIWRIFADSFRVNPLICVFLLCFSPSVCASV